MDLTRDTQCRNLDLLDMPTSLFTFWRLLLQSCLKFEETERLTFNGVIHPRVHIGEYSALSPTQHLAFLGQSLVNRFRPSRY
jgi:hypothetical protein